MRYPTKLHKLYLGGKPTPESGYFLLHTLKTIEGQWAVYEDALSSPKWWLYRICSQQPVARKANYSLAYSAAEQRLTGKDLVLLAKHRPALLSQFLQVVGVGPVQYWGQSFSTSVDSMLAKETQ